MSADEYKNAFDKLAYDDHEKKLASIKEILDNKTKLNQVYETVEKYLYIDDRNRIDLILATVLSNQISGTPIWIFIVGSSGDWKSTFIKSLEKLPNAIKVDQITKNTLATGLKNESDLGQELENKSTILLCPDIASLTSMNKDEKNAIWGQLRTLYDGDIFKRTGSGVCKAYEKCHVTIIAGTTPSIREEVLIHSQLGTRELLYDAIKGNPEAEKESDNKKMDMAWENENYEKEMQEDIEKVVLSFLQTHKPEDIEIPNEIRDFLKTQAHRLAILRATSPTDRIYQELLNPMSPEKPTRLIKQLKRIWRCLKSLDENYPDDKAKEIITHIINSSGDKVRCLILNIFEKNPEKFYTIKEVMQEIRLGRKTVKRQLEQLWFLDVLKKEVREERIGGFFDSYSNEVRGGRLEDVSYYKYNN